MTHVSVTVYKDGKKIADALDQGYHFNFYDCFADELIIWKPLLSKDELENQAIQDGWRLV